MSVLWICAAVVAAVFAVMLYSYATFRRGGTDATAKENGTRENVVRHSALVETLWAIVPIAIMVGTALPAVRQLLSIADGSPATPTLQAHRQDFS